MSTRYRFNLTTERRQNPLPDSVIVGQESTESMKEVMLKVLGYALLYRPGLAINRRLHNDHIPFDPDLVLLDYELRPVLWGECGESEPAKLDKLAVKVPEAAIWVLRDSAEQAQHLLRSIQKHGLRRGRYHVIGFDSEMFLEASKLVALRNDLHWADASFDPPHLQFDLNGLWFDAPFTYLHH